MEHPRLKGGRTSAGPALDLDPGPADHTYLVMNRAHLQPGLQGGLNPISTIDFLGAA